MSPIQVPSGLRQDDVLSEVTLGHVPRAVWAASCQPQLEVCDGLQLPSVLMAEAQWGDQ